MKTAELTGAALDWAVHIALHGACEGYAEHEYTTDWSQGGPIIHQEHMEFDWDEATQMYSAYDGVHGGTGQTHLIAAMRCYVASKLGDEVEIPQELA